MTQKANSTQPATSIYPQSFFPDWQAIIPGISQTVAVGGSSTQSVAFGATTTLVRCVVSTDAWIKFGTNPTADKTTSIFMPSGSIDYFGVTPGFKVACLQDSASGNLVVTEAA